MKGVHFLILASILLYACKKVETQKPPVETPITYPVKVGSKWIYTRTNYDDIGTTVKSTVDITYTVTGDTIINKEKWFIITSASGRQVMKFAVEGNYTWMNNAPQMELWFAVIGTSYSIKASDSSMATRNIVAIDDPVTVPAGTFTAYKTEDYTGARLQGYYWYNKDQFLIKKIAFTPDPVDSGKNVCNYIIELKSFDI